MNKLLKTGLTCLVAPLLLTTSLPTFAENKDYTAAEVYTADSWLYGKYVFRMRAPEGSGILSNFFLWKPDSETSSVDWEEVDIEVFGKNGATSWQSNIITNADGWTTSEQVHEHTASFSDDYHTFSIEWTSDYIAWFVDGEELRRTQGGQQDLLISEASLRFNLWASESENWVGDFDDSILPVHLYINWLEYYSWNGETFDLDWRDDFNSFDSNRWSQADWTFDGNYVDFVPENSSISNGYLVLSITNNGEEGFVGTVPLDSDDDDEFTDLSDLTDDAVFNETDDQVVTDSIDDQVVDNTTGSTDDQVVDNSTESTDVQVVDNSTESTDVQVVDNSIDDQVIDNASDDQVVSQSTENTGEVNCTYTVTSEWNAGFVVDISITNNSNSVINNWTASWQYSDTSSVNNAWNASVSGSNPYTAENLSWNSTIAIGETVSFGFTGTKSSTDTEIPTITGDICT